MSDQIRLILDNSFQKNKEKFFHKDKEKCFQNNEEKSPQKNEEESLQKNEEESLQRNEKNYYARLVFDDEFIGFQGHFPGQPVLPGIVMIQTLQLMCEKITGKNARLQSIKDSRFMVPVFPNQLVTLVATLPRRKKAEGTLVKGIFYNGHGKEEKIVAKISILLDMEGDLA
ncbi:hypothetical protein [Desulfamplus magnetovallimortis]|uniref:hypothetical protein n=1 Tax=Desulfamplus magnetovallimortis TaxID=1246637 RepID=UPI0016457220|nr:hypothetical protein [Desulfamplus magnetovallimortis]